MKKLLIICSVIMLSGCLATTSKVKFPEAPEELQKDCGTLEVIQPDNHQFSNFLNVVVDNYGTYYECKLQADGWKRWYDEQKKIFNEAMQ
jgi:hypothetical protein